MSYTKALEDWVVTYLNASVQGGWATLKAPCHHDKSASGRLNLADGWFYCHACCEGCWADQLAERYGLTQPPDKRDPNPGLEISTGSGAEYIYYDSLGRPLYKTVKRVTPEGKKKFAQARWTGKEWDFSAGCLDQTERILFNLPELIKTDGPVLFVEGEKDVNTAARLGFVATSTPQGAGKADKVKDWSALKGREVVILPDNDQPGRDHATSVANLLTPIAGKVVVADLPGIPEKGDLSDWVSMGGNRRKLTELVCDKLSKATPDRRWIELHYIVSAWDEQKAAEQLSTFDLSHWKDADSRKVASAIKELIAENQPIEHCYIAEKLRENGHLEAFLRVEKFENDNLARIKPGSDGPRLQFAKAIQREKNQKFLEKLQRNIETGDPFAFIAQAHEASGTLLEGQSKTKHRTLKEVADEVLQRIATGEARETIHLPLFSEQIGPVGGGDVIPYCGPPKTGKSFLLRTVREGLAREGVATLTGQLELRDDQVASREFCATLGTYEPDQLMAKRLLKENNFDHLAQAYFTTTGNNIETYKAEVWSILAAHPEIKVWFTDYNERIYEYGKNTNTNLQAAAVANFVKDTAKRFGVVAVVLLQPNDRYYAEALYGPRVDHCDYGKKWVKDAYALGFMHSPSRFDKGESPEDLLELHWLVCRGTQPGVQKYRFEPEKARFTPYGDKFSFPKPARKTAVNQLRAHVDDNEAFESLEGEDFDF